MNETFKDQDVLLVKEKDSDELKVVKGINPENKKLDTLSSKSENQPDFLKIDRHGNALDNFLANFSRQFKDPTHFIFFKVPANKVEEAANNLQEALKNPETSENKEFLDMHRVEPQMQTQKEYAINPDLVNWEKFEKYGITRDGLGKTGNLEKLLDYQKTDLMPVSINFEDETLRSDARFSLRKQDDGTFTPVVHLIRHKPDLERPYFGIRFTEEDKLSLLKTGNLGRIVEAEYKQGEKTPVLLSIDKQTNELVAFRKEWLKVPDAYKGVTLNEEQKQKLSAGHAVRIEDMSSSIGKKFSADVQFSADKRYFELLKKQSQKQDTGQNEAKELHIPKKLLGADLTDKQRNSLQTGETVYVSGMKDKEGQAFNAYVKINTEKNKLDFFKWNPDKAQKQGAEVKPDNAHTTQVTKNNDGNSTEAVKNVKEPLKQGQTQPDKKQVEKQQEQKPKGNKKRL